jgi:hypothetical protein
MLNNMTQEVWKSVRPSVSQLMAVIETVRNRNKFRQMAQEMLKSSLKDKSGKGQGISTIASAVSVRWYSLVKMLSSAIALRPVIEAYLAVSAHPRLLKKLQRAQTAVLAGDSPAPIQSESDREAELDDIGGEPPSDGITPSQFTPSQHEPLSQSHSGIGIPEDEWQLAGTANRAFGFLRSVMTVLELDEYGMIAQIYPGLLFLERSIGEIEDVDVRYGWSSAHDVFNRWRARYPKMPTESHRRAAPGWISGLVYPDDAMPLYEFTALLRPSNLTLIQEGIPMGSWQNLLNCTRVVFEAVKAKWNIREPVLTSESDTMEFSRTRRFQNSPEPYPSEWERYTSQQLPASADDRLHDWWQAHQTEFPCFYRLAQLYLIIPATSAGVERMFSQARRVLDRLRLRMKPENAELLVYLRENIEIVEKFRSEGRQYG